VTQTILDLESRRKAEELLKTERTPSQFISWDLSIAGKDFTPRQGPSPRLRSFTRTEDDEQGVALTLTATVAGNLPLSYQYEPMILRMRVGPYEVMRFKGECEAPLSEGGNTEITAHTAGFWLDQIKLNEQLEIVGWEPERVAFTMLNRAPYERSLIYVQPAAFPIFNARDAEGEFSFMPFQSIAEPLGILSESAMYAFRDTALNGVQAQVMAARPSTPEWNFTLGPDELEITPPPQEDEGLFSHVIVYRVLPNAISGLTEAKPLTLPMVVPGSKAPQDSWLWIEVSDDSPSAIRNGIQRARAEADRMTGIRKRGIFTQRFINPFLTRGASVTIEQRDYDDEGYFLRSWAGTIIGITDEISAESQLQTYTVDMLLVDEERLAAPAPPIRRPSYAFRTPRLGTDPMGRFFLDDTLPWVTIINESMVDIDEAGAAAMGVGITTDPDISAIYFDNEAESNPL
jgi:hypothetical protein